MSEAFAGMMVTPSVKLVRPLGEGGMGAVWVADHLALRTQVVVKFIASGLTNSKEARDRFSREAAAASQVKSPHVVQTFDHGVTDEGVPYIVMELLEGRELGEYLDEQGKLPPDLAVEIASQLARALDRAHERGIIHRDIKPGNIYLCDVGRDGEVFVKLLDFGIAKGIDLSGITNRVDSGTKTGSMIGSPFYMSPEQILGSKEIDHRSDLWSVGVVAFEMICGRKPFDAETMGGLAIRIHSEPLPLATDVNPALPATVDAWFARACARDVKERFDSAKEMVEALALALGGQAPKSLGPAPRLSTSGSARRVDPGATTLAAGAATDAGVVRPTTQSRVRGRMLVMLGIFVVLTPIAYVGVRGMLSRDVATPLVPAEPMSANASESAKPIVSVGTATTPTVATASSVVPVPVPMPVPDKRKRPRPSAAPTIVRAVTSAASIPSLPLPPVTTSTPTAPRPATSGHDIF